MNTRLLTLLSVILGILALLAAAQTERYGLFEDASDVGAAPKGSLEVARNEYRVTGGGANMWARRDDFHFVWRKLSGDLKLTADVQFVGDGKITHRKATLMVRQNLAPTAACADVAVHGDRLTSLQYRPAEGEETAEIKAQNEWFGSPELIPSAKAPKRIRLERRGNQFVMYAGNPGGWLAASEAVTVVLKDPIYVGLAVCSHDSSVLETAIFSNVSLEGPPTSAREPVKSKVSIFNLKDKSSRRYGRLVSPSVAGREVAALPLL